MLKSMFKALLLTRPVYSAMVGVIVKLELMFTALGLGQVLLFTVIRFRQVFLVYRSLVIRTSAYVYSSIVKFDKCSYL